MERGDGELQRGEGEVDLEDKEVRRRGRGGVGSKRDGEERRRGVFFSTLYGENTESALPLLNLLDLLTVDNIYKHQKLKFIHNWHKHQLPSIFDK